MRGKTENIHNTIFTQFTTFSSIMSLYGQSKRTIAIWKNKENPNISSVNFKPIYGDSKNELSIGIKSDMGFDQSELKIIFKTVEIK